MIAELAEQYMTDHVAVRCKPTTARSCRHILDKFLLPQFGAQRLSEIMLDEVATLHYRLRETPIMANQVLSLLSRIFHKAAASDDAPPGDNRALSSAIASRCAGRHSSRKCLP